MGRDTVQLETAISTISQEYILEFTSEYGILEALHPELPGPKDKIVDFPKGKDGMPAENTYSPEDVRVLDTHRTPIQKQPEALLYLVGLSRRYYLRDEVYLTFLHDDDRVDWAVRPGNCGPGGAAPRERDYHRRCSRGMTRGKGCCRSSPAAKERRKRGHDEVDTNAPPLSPTPAPPGAPADVSDPYPLSFADPQSRPAADIAQSSKGAAAAGDSESENTSFASMVGSPESIYRPEWGVTNGSALDTPKACQDLVDHVAPPGYFSELRHLHNDEFLKQYNVNLARQVAMGSQLRLRFEQEAKLLKKSVAQVARRDKRIQARENELKNLETLLEAEADMKKAAEDKSAKLSQELENMRTLFSDLQDAPMDVIMASLHLESDTRDDAPQWVRELHPSSSQLTIPVYPEVRDPMDPWACNEEILLADAIAANVSRAEKKKKCRVVCHTHRVGSAHHARFDGVPVSVPTVVPKGLAILLADAATQTETSDETSQLLRSSSLPVMHS
nr:hypothetical protein [Tanacetum cinerariifolium]